MVAGKGAIGLERESVSSSASLGARLAFLSLVLEARTGIEIKTANSPLQCRGGAYDASPFKNEVGARDRFGVIRWVRALTAEAALARSVGYTRCRTLVGLPLDSLRTQRMMHRQHEHSRELAGANGSRREQMRQVRSIDIRTRLSLDRARKRAELASRFVPSSSGRCRRASSAKGCLRPDTL